MFAANNIFTSWDMQPLSVTSTSASGNFVGAGTSAPPNTGAVTQPTYTQIGGHQQCSNVIVYNTGTADAYLVFSNTASPTAVNAAPFGAQYYIPAGTVQSFDVGQARYFAGICAAGNSTSLVLVLGIGS